MSNGNTSACPSCNATLLPGSRWCSICRVNVMNPAFGTLSSPGKRLGAHVLDMLVPIVALILIFFVASIGAVTGSEAGIGFSVLLGFALAIVYIIWALKLFARGTTPGKSLLGMHVMTVNGQRAGFLTMLVREWVGKFISGLILSLGFFWILFDRDSQGWHDKLVSTFVVNTAQGAPIPPSVAAHV